MQKPRGTPKPLATSRRVFLVLSGIAVTGCAFKPSPQPSSPRPLSPQTRDHTNPIVTAPSQSDEAGSLADVVTIDGKFYLPVYAYKPYLTDSLLGPTLGSTSAGTSIKAGAPVRAIQGVDPKIAAAMQSDAPGFVIAAHDSARIRVTRSGWVPCYRNRALATPTPLPVRPPWATTDPRFDFVPTPTPRPTVGSTLNPAQHYQLATANGLALKGAIRGGLIHDVNIQGQLLAVLDAKVAVDHLAPSQIPPDDRTTILLIWTFAQGQQVLRYHLSDQRIYVPEDGITFAAPKAFVATLAPLAQPRPG